VDDETLLHGKHLIGRDAVSSEGAAFTGWNPATGESLVPEFHEAGEPEVTRALALAEQAAPVFRRTPGKAIAAFLDTIGSEIEKLGNTLIERAHQETGLPVARLQGERARMLAGIRIFAEVAREGSWVGARIDHADPERKPLPKPDVRTLNVALGPIVVFGASNFPLAISVAGTDTVSALGVGCPVVVKAHPAHPGTSELIGRAIQTAARAHELPEGVFSMLHGESHELGLGLVRHPATKAVAFTGSQRGGRALFDAAARRPVPVPVYAEMGSTNPVLLLPGALAERAKDIAPAYIQSVTLGVGQFCTNPGLVLGLEDESLAAFRDAAASYARDASPATMLTRAIRDTFQQGVERAQGSPGVRVAGASEAPARADRSEAACVILSVGAENLNDQLLEENFGPSSVVVGCRTRDELSALVAGLDGHLTASVHATEQDLKEYRDVIEKLEDRVGRIIYGGFGTGIEVCAGMHHGGPYPSTTFPQFTSIGHAAFLRFVRPVCHQNCPVVALPAALLDENPLGIWRLVDNVLTNAGA